MTESTLYLNYIKPLLTHRGYYFYRVEHYSIPDIYCCKDNKVVWIELKVINKRRKNILRPDWRKGQLTWIREHYLFGNNYKGIVLLCLWYLDKYYFLYPKELYFLEELENSLDFK